METNVLIRQTLDTQMVWHVQVTSREWIQKIYESNRNYLWEVDCDTDAFIVHQNQLENSQESPLLHEETSRPYEVSKRTLAMWKNYPHPLAQDELVDWIQNAYPSIQQAYQSGDYPYPDLIPALAQDPSGKILMQAWVNEEALIHANQSGLGTYYSRSRNKIWIKGEESGHKQKLLSWTLQQQFPFTVIYHVQQTVAACHTGQYSCFFRELKAWNEHPPV